MDEPAEDEDDANQEIISKMRFHLKMIMRNMEKTNILMTICQMKI